MTMYDDVEDTSWTSTPRCETVTCNAPQSESRRFTIAIKRWQGLADHFDRKMEIDSHRRPQSSIAPANQTVHQRAGSMKRL